jgi:hypothetical protein
MATPDDVQAQLNRPVRDEGPAPPRTPKSPPFGVYGCLGLALIVLIALLLGFGGLFNAWIVAGVIVVAAGVALVIQLARRNRGA